ncbi:MAG: glutathione synthetase, partial [Bacteroidota bacterium]
MQKFKVLVLTDHTNHSAENSLYVMLQRMREHPRCAKIDIVTRANAANDFFFQKYTAEGLEVSPVGEDFGFSPEGKSFQQQRRKENLEAYDVAWLRLPPPIPKSFLIFLKHKFPNIIFVNDPDGIYQTGSKAFLSNFADVCAPMKLCRSLDDILNFSAQFPIVLKPLRDYGGKGIIKIE